MKKLISLIIFVIMLVSVIPMSIGAENPENMTFAFELSIDGAQQKTVQTGDIITVVFHLQRTDSSDDYTMYAMQNEIRYDSRFFELVEGSELVSKDIRTTDIALRDRHREFYMNYVSMGSGAEWSGRQLIGSFQLRVIATQGVSIITNEDALVSFRDGSGSYESTVNKLTVRISDKCLIEFDPGNGDPAKEVEAVYGKKLNRPENPEKEGYYFAGWYKDIDCTEKWDFEKDVVEENTTLYAKWSKDEADYDEYVPSSSSKGGKKCCWLWLLILICLIILFLIIILLFTKKVTFNSMGGSNVKSKRVFKGKKVKRPSNPSRPGYTLVGWAKDEACTIPWYFGKDEVDKSITLYAKWKKD